MKNIFVALAIIFLLGCFKEQSSPSEALFYPAQSNKPNTPENDVPNNNHASANFPVIGDDSSVSGSEMPENAENTQDDALLLPEVYFSFEKATLTFNTTWPENFMWSKVLLCEQINSGGCTVIKQSTSNSGLSFKLGEDVSLKQLLNDQLTLQFYSINGQVLSQKLTISAQTVNDTVQYFKASNNQTYSKFGLALALSGDGRTLAISAPEEDHNVSRNPGVVYIFSHEGAGWRQSALLKAPFPRVNDYFGANLSFSDDGQYLAVASPGDDGVGIGVDSDPAQQHIWDKIDFGAVFLYKRQGNLWLQEAYFKPTIIDPEQNVGRFDHIEFGKEGMSLSGDGSMLAVSSPKYPYIDTFIKVNNQWQVYSKIIRPSVEDDDRFGQSVELNFTGSLLFVGAPGNDSSSIDIPDADNSLKDSGGIYTFRKTAGSYVQESFFKPIYAKANSQAGKALKISKDGNVLVTNSEDQIYLYDYVAQRWRQRYFFKLPAPFSQTIQKLELSKDEKTLAVYTKNAPLIAGINAAINNSETFSYGAVLVYKLEQYQPVLQYRLQHNFPTVDDSFGSKMALSRDGAVLVASAPLEDAKADGINNEKDDFDPASSRASNSGAAWVYQF